jgi:alkyl hydroperoxide reductase subunit AhpC
MIRKAAATLAGLGAMSLMLALAPAQQQQQLAAVSDGPVVGQPAPAFTAVDTHGKTHSLAQHRGKFVVLEWLNHGCPWVQKWYREGHMQALQRQFAEMDVVWYSVVSSAPGNQGHETRERHNEMAAARGAAPAAILIDEPGIIGRAYDARTTPHMYVIDPDGTLIYMGAIDDNRGTSTNAIAGARNHVVEAVREAMAGQPVSVPSSQPYGCAVRYGRQ